jgi:hypothetical protein
MYVSETMPKRFCGVPTFFRACCQEAAQSRGRQGSGGYANAGYHLTRHVTRLIPFDTEPEEWATETEKLGYLLMPGEDRVNRALRDDDAVWRWFTEHMPRCMELVPTRRRGQFVKGAYQCAEEEDFDWTDV